MVLEEYLELVLRHSKSEFVCSIDYENNGLTLGIVVLP